ncbi:hypothetical protein PR048_006939 [Dryococelus australis]|uniref:Uncharacterized protein n=1 Tax=Dryococelus australis TaxID=614101 RepID=A0ABQ9ICB8_9NEOP|nr:hypothetical protein PR048_006939 [Dryococelus australis]
MWSLYHERRVPHWRGRGGVVARLPASHQGEPDSIPSGMVPRSSCVVFVQDDTSGRRIFSGISCSPHHSIPELLHTHLVSPSSALKTSLLRAAQIFPLHDLCRFQKKFCKRVGCSDQHIVYSTRARRTLPYQLSLTSQGILAETHSSCFFAEGRSRASSFLGNFTVMIHLPSFRWSPKLSTVRCQRCGSTIGCMRSSDVRHLSSKCCDDVRLIAVNEPWTTSETTSRDVQQLAHHCESATSRTCVNNRSHITKANGTFAPCGERLYMGHHKLEVHGRRKSTHRGKMKTKGPLVRTCAGNPVLENTPLKFRWHDVALRGPTLLTIHKHNLSPYNKPTCGNCFLAGRERSVDGRVVLLSVGDNPENPMITKSGATVRHGSSESIVYIQNSITPLDCQRIKEYVMLRVDCEASRVDG